MDTITHSLFAIVLNNKKVSILLLILFLNLPDIFSTPFNSYCIIATGNKLIPEVFLNLPIEALNCYLNFYRFFHSLTFWLIMSVILILLNKDFWILSLGHLTHIIVDAFTHNGIWGTRILYPFSDFYIKGIHYRQHPILFLVFPIIVVTLYFLKKYIKNKKKKKNPN